MQTKILAKEGPHLSSIGFGTWAYFEPAFQKKLSNKKFSRSIASAYELGINWIDVAPVIGFGKAERMVGRAVKALPRDKIFISTKCGISWDKNSRLSISLHPRDVRTSVENSLRRLGTNYIDLCQPHFPDAKTPIIETWYELKKLHNEGKIKHIGLCNHGIEAVKSCMKLHPVQIVQTPYSLLFRDAQDEILPFCEQNGVGVLSYPPLQLDSLMRNLRSPEPNGAKSLQAKPVLVNSQIQKTVNLLEQIQPIAYRQNISIAQLALAWMLTYSSILGAVVSTSSKRQLRDYVRIAEKLPPKREIRSVGAAIAETAGL